MALFKGATPVLDTKDQYFRSNTKLQAGTHDSPGEKFLVDPRLKGLFRYHFGGDGWVVIPKGRAVAISTDDGGEFKNGTINDFDANVQRPVLTLANGGKDVLEVGKSGQDHTRTANKAIGVAYGNLYEEFVDGFNGMQPTVENEIYIELPYIPSRANAEEIEWGSFYDKDIDKPVKHGDYVMSDENGRLIVADFEAQRDVLKSTEATADQKFAAIAEISRLQEQVIGQVWAVETNLPPQGWLQWVGSTDEQLAEIDSSSGMTADDIQDNKFPGYPYEKTYRNFDAKSSKYYPQGIPGLTNGSRIEVPFKDVLLGSVNPGSSGKQYYRIEKTPLVEGSVEIKVGGQVVEPANIHYESGLVTLEVNNTGNSPQEVTASFKATGQLPGVPTGWDWKGSVGAVRILLQK
ncbi:hypothetical protein [Virgibacillus salexigens]|uniref:Uncharacterized protein n=1 Tax=Virgibacillus massiliensis TaxID=1462526 RepID=A0A024QHV1_9BACI|nr:hypothetical protein [Virgibacillus massiliensis]CDQ41827.1 hypothetical protein BN990_04204 [Virgibacillus massiliensis]